VFAWFSDILVADADEDAPPPNQGNVVKGIFGKSWTARDVYRVHNEAKLKKKNTEQHGQLPGTAQFVDQYQQMI
jgi:hypothetical protein